MFLNYVKERKKARTLVSLPTVTLSYALVFVMSLKILSSIHGAIATHKKFQEKSFKKKIARKGLQSEDLIQKWNTDTDTRGSIEVVN